MTRGRRSLTGTARLGALALALLAGATAAEAQSRDGRWEFSLGTFYQLGTGVDGQQGQTLNTDDEFGLATAVSYAHAFMEQTSGVLQEELALLRGTDTAA